MKIRDLSLEQLEELEEELRQSDGEYSRLIQVYKEMHSRLVPLVRREPEEYQDYLQYVKNKLIACYIKYGTYLKMNQQKDDEMAIRSLKEAIKLDKSNPIAHYRLGFLSYKRKDYVNALQFFQAALDFQRYGPEHDYPLNEQQLFNAHMYLTNSALYVANQSHQAMEKLEWRSAPTLPEYELSPIYEMLAQNENYLFTNAFYQISKDQVSNCSVENCNEIVEHPPKNTVILYFGDRTTVCVFNGEEVELSVDRADVLRHMLLKCSAESPGTRFTFKHYFDSFGKDGEVLASTFRKRIERLRENLSKLGLAEAIIQTRHANETAYYFDKNIPYIVLYRVDDLVANEYIHL